MKSKLICKMEELLSARKRVILLATYDKKILDYVEEILNNRLMENVEIWHCINDVEQGSRLRRISAEEMKDVLEIYRIYDFSDKVIFISDSEQYGNLFNYVNNGILTTEEMVEALLYKI